MLLMYGFDLRPLVAFVLVVGIAVGGCTVKATEAGCGYLRAHVPWEASP